MAQGLLYLVLLSQPGRRPGQYEPPGQDRPGGRENNESSGMMWFKNYYLESSNRFLLLVVLLYLLPLAALAQNHEADQLRQKFALEKARIDRQMKLGNEFPGISEISESIENFGLERVDIDQQNGRTQVVLKGEGIYLDCVPLLSIEAKANGSQAGFVIQNKRGPSDVAGMEWSFKGCQKEMRKTDKPSYSLAQIAKYVSRLQTEITLDSNGIINIGLQPGSERFEVFTSGGKRIAHIGADVWKRRAGEKRAEEIAECIKDPNKFDNIREFSLALDELIRYGKMTKGQKEEEIAKKAIAELEKTYKDLKALTKAGRSKKNEIHEGIFQSEDYLEAIWNAFDRGYINEDEYEQFLDKGLDLRLSMTYRYVHLADRENEGELEEIHQLLMDWTNDDYTSDTSDAKSRSLKKKGLIIAHNAAKRIEDTDLLEQMFEDWADLLEGEESYVQSFGAEQLLVKQILPKLLIKKGSEEEEYNDGDGFDDLGLTRRSSSLSDESSEEISNISHLFERLRGLRMSSQTRARLIAMEEQLKLEPELRSLGESAKEGYTWDFVSQYENTRAALNERTYEIQEKVHKACSGADYFGPIQIYGEKSRKAAKSPACKAAQAEAKHQMNAVKESYRILARLPQQAMRKSQADEQQRIMEQQRYLRELQEFYRGQQSAVRNPGIPSSGSTHPMRIPDPSAGFLNGMNASFMPQTNSSLSPMSLMFRR